MHIVKKPCHTVKSQLEVVKKNQIVCFSKNANLYLIGKLIVVTAISYYEIKISCLILRRLRLGKYNRNWPHDVCSFKPNPKNTLIIEYGLLLYLFFTVISDHHTLILTVVGQELLFVLDGLMSCVFLMVDS